MPSEMANNAVLCKQPLKKYLLNDCTVQSYVFFRNSNKSLIRTTYLAPKAGELFGLISSQRNLLCFSMPVPRSVTDCWLIPQGWRERQSLRIWISIMHNETFLLNVRAEQ